MQGDLKLLKGKAEAAINQVHGFMRCPPEQNREALVELRDHINVLIEALGGDIEAEMDIDDTE